MKKVKANKEAAGYFIQSCVNDYLRNRTHEAKWAAYAAINCAYFADVISDDEREVYLRAINWGIYND